MQGNKAKLIRTVRADNSTFSLDAGYRIVYFDDDAMKTTRIDTGISWVVPDSTVETLQENAISPNRRLVATYGSLTTYGSLNNVSQFSIWDLKTGELRLAVHAFNGMKIRKNRCLKKGWGVWAEDSLSDYSVERQLQGSIHFFIDEETGLPKHSPWILRDGSAV